MKKTHKLLALVTAGLVIAGGFALADPSPSGGGPLKPCASCAKIAPTGGAGELPQKP